MFQDTPSRNLKDPFNDSNRRPVLGDWLICVHSVSDVLDKSTQATQLHMWANAVRSVAIEWSRYHPNGSLTTYWMAPDLSDTYGSNSHLCRLTTNIIDVGRNIYSNLCTNLHRIEAINFIAADSGAYLVKRFVEFIDYHGGQFHNLVEFDMAWALFLAHGQLGKREEDNVLSQLIRNVMLVHPSLPSPTGMSRLLWYWTKPQYYDHREWDRCQYDQLTTDTTRKSFSVALLLNVDQKDEGEPSYKAVVDVKNEVATGMMLMEVPKIFHEKTGYAMKCFKCKDKSSVVEWLIEQDKNSLVLQ